MVQCLMLISDTVVKADNSSKYLRRMAICRHLREQVQRPIEFGQPSVAMTLATAICAEYRSGDIEAAKCHGRALQNWFFAGGGFNTMADLSLPNQIGLLVIFTSFDISIFQDENDLESALSRFRLPTGRRAARLMNFVFASGEGPQIALLYILNRLLEHCLTDPFRAFEYGVFGETKIAPGALIFMVAQLFGRRTVDHKPSFCGLEATEFVQLLSFASKTTRTCLVRFLSETLCGRHSDDVELEDVKDEIRQQWTRRHSADMSNESYREASNPSLNHGQTSDRLPWTLDVSIDSAVCPFSGSGDVIELRCPMRVRSSSSSSSGSN
jgi:hypothetical protein